MRLGKVTPSTLSGKCIANIISSPCSISRRKRDAASVVALKDHLRVIPKVSEADDDLCSTGIVHTENLT